MAFPFFSGLFSPWGTIGLYPRLCTRAIHLYAFLNCSVMKSIAETLRVENTWKRFMSRIAGRVQDFSRLCWTPGLYRNAAMLFVLALGARLGIWFFIVHRFGVDGFLYGDSGRYIAVATNLLAGHGYGSSTEAPFLLDNARTPGYPFFLLFFFFVKANYAWIALAQAILSAVIPLLVVRIGKRLLFPSVVVYGAALFVALSPTTIFWSVGILTESLFTLFFLSGFLSFFNLLDSPESKRDAALFGMIWGLANGIRPVLTPLFVLALLFLLFRHRLSLRRAVRTAALAAVVFGVILSPWIVRNVRVFGTASMTSLFWPNVYVTYVTGITAIREHIPWPAAQRKTLAVLEDRYGIYKKTRWLPQSIPVQRKLALESIRSAPVQALTIFSTSLFSFFTHDSTADLLRRFAVLPAITATTRSSVTLQLLQGAFLKAGQTLFFEQGIWGMIPIMLRVFWFFLFIGFIFSFFSALSSRARAVSYARLICWLVVCGVAAATTNIGIAVEQRHRYPVEPLLLLLGGAGIFLLFHCIAAFFEKRRMLAPVAKIFMPEDHMDALYTARNPLVRFIHVQRLDRIVAAIRVTDQNILDAGCGEGHLLERIAHRFPSAVCFGIDATEVALRRARERVRADFRVGDLRALPYTSDTFAVVTCTEVLEHIPDPVVVARELLRVTAPGGRIILTVPNETNWTLARFFLGRRPIKVPDHVNAFHFRDIEKLFRLPCEKISLPFPFLPSSFSLNRFCIITKPTRL